MNEKKEKEIVYTGINRLFRSDNVQVLWDSLHDGTIREFLDDWKWIFSYSRRYRWIVVFYTVLGIFGSTASIGSAYVGRILINIVVSQQREKLWLLISVTVGATLLSLALGSVNSYISTRISIYVNNDIQAGIFDRIMDARWKELSAYPSGDLLNRFNGDVGTVAANAISWIPNLTKLCEKHLGLPAGIMQNVHGEDDITDELLENLLANGNFGSKQPPQSSKTVENIQTVIGIIKKKGLFLYFQDNGLAAWKLCKKYPALKPFAFIYGFFRFLIRGAKGIVKTRKVKEQIETVNRKHAFQNELGIRTEEQNSAHKKQPPAR